MRLKIKVIDAIDKEPLRAEVHINGRTYLTGPSGVVFISLRPGSYRITVKAPGYEEYSTFRVFEEGTYEITVPLMPKFRLLR